MVTIIHLFDPQQLVIFAVIAADVLFLKVKVMKTTEEQRKELEAKHTSEDEKRWQYPS